MSDSFRIGKSPLAKLFSAARGGGPAPPAVPSTRVLSELASSFCGSFIGSHDKRMCIRKDCPTESHSKPGRKASIIFQDFDSDESIAFIQYKSDSASVYTDPIKRVSEFGSGFSRFMQSTRTVPAWISLFGLPPEAQPQTDEDGSEMILRVDRAAPVGLTPKKKKARFLSEEPDRDKDEFMILMDLPEVGGLDPQEMVARIRASWPVMQENQKQIGFIIASVRKKASQLATEVAQDMDSIDVRFDRANRVVGDWTDEFATSSLCKVATDLVTDLDVTVARVAKLEDKPNMDPTAVQAEVTKGLEKWVESDLKPLYVLYTKLSSSLHSPADRFEALVARVTALEARDARPQVQAQQAVSPQGLANMFVNTPALPQGDPMDTDDSDVKADIREIKAELCAIRNELMDDRVEISTVAFVSEPQSHSWMYANCIPGKTFYRFYDA
eukprot:scaffold18598_cov49-Attheya_sp.AAC.1